MKGQRKLIKKRIAAILQAAAVELGVSASNIFTNRAIDTFVPDKFPCLVINSREETVQTILADTPVREYQLIVPITIDCLVVKPIDIGDDLDDLVDGVIDVLLRHELDQFSDDAPAWGDLVLTRAGGDLRGDTRGVLGLGQVEFNVTYQAKADTVAPVTLEEAVVDYQFNVTPTTEGTATNTVQDDIVFPEEV